MKLKAVTGIMLTLFLTFTLNTMLVTPVAAYPFEYTFKKDLLDIANSVPQIESIYIKSWLDFRPGGHLWAFIRINYIAGLSDYEKIAIQINVQHQLESKRYIDIVEPNYIYTIPEEPPPWPGFVIGDLNVAFKSVISAVVEINPGTLNLKCKGKWITAYIELPEGYNVSDVDVSSLKLNNGISGDLNAATWIGDYDSDGVLDLMVKFNRTELTAHIYHTLGIKYGNITLAITGRLIDGTLFEGCDIVKVLFGGDINRDGIVNYLDLFQLVKSYGSTPDKSNWNPDADLDGNGRMNYVDLFVLAANYRVTVP